MLEGTRHRADESNDDLIQTAAGQTHNQVQPEGDDLLFDSRDDDNINFGANVPTIESSNYTGMQHVDDQAILMLPSMSARG